MTLKRQGQMNLEADINHVSPSGFWRFRDVWRFSAEVSWWHPILGPSAEKLLTLYTLTHWESPGYLPFNTKVVSLMRMEHWTDSRSNSILVGIILIFYLSSIVRVGFSDSHNLSKLKFLATLIVSIMGSISQNNPQKQ